MCNASQKMFLGILTRKSFKLQTAREIWQEKGDKLSSQFALTKDKLEQIAVKEFGLKAL